jgi:hypothetical protein
MHQIEKASSFGWRLLFSYEKYFGVEHLWKCRPMAPSWIKHGPDKPNCPLYITAAVAGTAAIAASLGVG